MKKIIIVDDDPTNNHVIETMLHKLVKGIESVSFINPVKALDYLIDHRANFSGLVMLDINMPEMSGWQFIDAMHENKIIAPVIMLTSSINFQDKEFAGGLKEIKDFFVKPINTNMIKRIKEFI